MTTKPDKPDNENEFHDITVTIYPAASDLLYQLCAGASGSRKLEGEPVEMVIPVRIVLDLPEEDERLPGSHRLPEE